MRRRAGAVLLLAVAALGALLLLNTDVGRAREPGRAAGARDVPEAEHASKESGPAPSVPVLESLEAVLARFDAVDGTVHDVDRERPFAGAQVRLFRIAGKESRDSWADGPPDLVKPTHETLTDALGKFEIGDDYHPAVLVVDAPGYLPVLHFTDRCLCHDIDLTRGKNHRLRAVDQEGHGLDDAEAVIFSHGGPPRAVAPAGAGGWIGLSLATEDQIVVRAPGRCSTVCEEPLATETVVLDAEHPLRGVVITPGGDPVEGVRLTLSREPWPMKRTTGPDGAFAFDGLGASAHRLEVEPQGRPSRSLTAWPGDQRMRIVLDGATARGVASLCDGRAAAGAFVTASSVGSRADESGRFVIEGVPAGEVWLRGSWQGPDGVEFTGGSDIYLEDGEEIEGDLVLSPAARSRVKVRVVTPDGEPARASIQASGFDDDSLAGNTSWGTDDAGRTVIETRDPPGTRLSLWARDPPRSMRGGEGPAPTVGETSALTTADGTGPEAVIRLRPSVPVTFTIRRADGGPLPVGAEVEVELGDGTWCEKGTASPDRCALRCVDRGYASLSVRADGFVPIWISPFEPPPGGGEVEIRLEREVRIVGRVVRSDGTPVAAPFLQRDLPPLTSLVFDYATWDDVSAPRTEVAAAPGEALLLSAGDGIEARWFRRIEVPRDREVLDLGDIVLLPPVGIRGVVLGPDGEPEGGVRISLDPSMGFSSDPFVTREDGRFDIEAPPWDETRVVVEKDGLAVDPIPLAAFREGKRAVRMQRAAKLVAEGYMCDLKVRRLDGDASWHPQDGSWTRRVVVELPPGRFAVEAEGVGWTDTREIELSPGKTTRLALGPR